MAGGGPDDEPPKLIRSVATDAGRHFFDAPPEMSMADCVVRLGQMEGAEIVSLMPADIGEWLVFRVEGYRFSASDPVGGEVWFHADDPATPEALLQKIAMWVVAPTNPS